MNENKRWREIKTSEGNENTGGGGRRNERNSSPSTDASFPSHYREKAGSRLKRATHMLAVISVNATAELYFLTLQESQS